LQLINLLISVLHLINRSCPEASSHLRVQMGRNFMQATIGECLIN
jgi:hypothetical protein